MEENEFDFFPVISEDELPNGERLFLEINHQPVVVFNIGGNYYAIGDTCTHDDGPLGDGRLEGFEIVCPRHGARFDVRTGAALKLPAVVATDSYPVRVIEGMIQIGVRKIG